MKRLVVLILSLAAIIALASCEPAEMRHDEFGKDKRFEYNINAILIEKFSDGKFHFICEDIKDGRIFTYDWYKDSEGAQKKYDNRRVGDTCFFEFINKDRFKK